MINTENFWLLVTINGIYAATMLHIIANRSYHFFTISQAVFRIILNIVLEPSLFLIPFRRELMTSV